MQSSILKPAPPLILFAIGLALLVYANGLHGPFLFDDHIHITQNRYVQIDSLSADDLAQAWNSSFSRFPANRPLAQLSFGINHALAGLDPWAFKLTNLLIHLASGLLVFVFTRLLYRALAGETYDPARGALFAAATAALWLLHPLHVSTVLYTVQRMAQLSSLGTLLALSAYLHGRLEIAAGRPGGAWMLLSAPLALLAFLAKENAALLPLLLLVLELTVLARVGFGTQRRFVRGVQLAYIAVPLLAGAGYLATHLELVSYTGRDFTLEQRLLTQPRVLWTYLQWLFVPDVTAFALFHDDLVVSTSWLSPWTTLPAALGLLVATGAALAGRRRYPVAAFALLFFLGNHALESSVLPLEMMFEHRNYLASVGPLALAAYLVTVSATPARMRRLALLVSALLLLAYSAVTWVRVDHWSSYSKFVLTSAEHHPGSLRSNFMAAQALISGLDAGDGDRETIAAAARDYLDAGLAIDPDCIDCLLGKVVLALHLDRQPDPALLERLLAALRSGHVGPTRVSVSQFNFLVSWQRSDATRLAPADFEAIFEAALANPAWPGSGRAGLASAYREYHEHVTGDLAAALQYAAAAVDAWREQWGYHVHLVRVLRKAGLHVEALKALDAAAGTLRNARQRAHFFELRAAIKRDLNS